MKKQLTVKEVAELMSVREDQVRLWIANKELAASNASATSKGRSTWRIDPDDLDLFRKARASNQEPKPKKVRTNRGKTVPQYY